MNQVPPPPPMHHGMPPPPPAHHGGPPMAAGALPADFARDFSRLNLGANGLANMYANMHPNMGPVPVQDKKPEGEKANKGAAVAAKVETPASTVPVYEGWKFTKAEPEIFGKVPTWSRVNKSVLHFSQADLVRVVNRHKSKGKTPIKQYNELDQTKQGQLDRLIEDKNKEDPKYDWKLASVETEKRIVSERAYETASMQAIIMRRPRVGAKTAPIVTAVPGKFLSTSQKGMPGQIVDLNAPPKKEDKKDGKEKGGLPPMSAMYGLDPKMNKNPPTGPFFGTMPQGQPLPGQPVPGQFGFPNQGANGRKTPIQVFGGEKAPPPPPQHFGQGPPPGQAQGPFFPAMFGQGAGPAGPGQKGGKAPHVVNVGAAQKQKPGPKSPKVIDPRAKEKKVQSWVDALSDSEYDSADSVFTSGSDYTGETSRYSDDDRYEKPIQKRGSLNPSRRPSKDQGKAEPVFREHRRHRSSGSVKGHSRQPSYDRGEAYVVPGVTPRSPRQPPLERRLSQAYAAEPARRLPQRSLTYRELPRAYRDPSVPLTARAVDPAPAAPRRHTMGVGDPYLELDHDPYLRDRLWQQEARERILREDLLREDLRRQELARLGEAVRQEFAHRERLAGPYYPSRLSGYL